MPKNLGFTLTYRNETNWIPLYPVTTEQQVIDWNLGKINGPIQVTLLASGWVNRQQTVTMQGVTSNDILNCTKVLTGTQDQMEAQDKAYALLDSYIGIESLENAIRFTCTNAVPTVDLTVQIDWNR